VRVTVADTGVGIEPHNLDRLFEPFFTTKSHGTGLGLPITRRIVQEHNGQITVQSELKKGTTFSILFPAGGKIQ
jgi:signal transduction histidine kinase